MKAEREKETRTHVHAHAHTQSPRPTPGNQECTEETDGKGAGTGLIDTYYVPDTWLHPEHSLT